MEIEVEGAVEVEVRNIEIEDVQVAYTCRRAERVLLNICNSENEDTAGWMVARHK